MQPFRFRLERVLAWRRAQARSEEARLEALHAELRSLGARAEEIAHERNTASRALTASGGANGAELALLDSFYKAASQKISRLQTAQADCRRRVDTQMEAVTNRRREVKLLERLRERRSQAWQAEFAREMEREAAESHLSRNPAQNAPGARLGF